MSRPPRTTELSSSRPNPDEAGARGRAQGIARAATLFLAGACTATAVAVLFARDPGPRTAFHSPQPAAPSAARPAARTLPRLHDVLGLGDAGLAAADIALLNLACAEGLPGAESLDIAATLAELDRWAAHVASETERNLHRFREGPAEYENSEAYFRALVLVVALQGDLGVRYNPERIAEPDFTNPKDLFLHGMVADPNGGTCVSMPVLYVAVGRRLGYPMRLAVAKGHVFARWDAPGHADPALRGRFNVEGTNRGLGTPDDGHYAEWPMRLSDAERADGWHLRSLEPAEEFAVFLMQRGHCLEDTGRLAEAQVAYAIAHRLAPRSPEALGYLLAAAEREAAAGDGFPRAGSATDASREAAARRAAGRRRLAEDIGRQAAARGRALPARLPAPNTPSATGLPQRPGPGTAQ